MCSYGSALCYNDDVFHGRRSSVRCSEEPSTLAWFLRWPRLLPFLWLTLLLQLTEIVAALAAAFGRMSERRQQRTTRFAFALLSFSVFSLWLLWLLWRRRNMSNKGGTNRNGCGKLMLPLESRRCHQPVPAVLLLPAQWLQITIVYMAIHMLLRLF